MAKQSGGNTAQRVEALVRPTVEGMGLRLWDVVFEKEGPDWYLRVLIDKDGTMDTDTCADVSHALDPEMTMEIKGRNLVDGLPKNIVVHSEDVREALLECLVKITSAIKETLERTPPELSADIIDRGITLTGGGALLRGLDQLIQSETGIDVHIAEDPLDCVAKGAGAVLDHVDVLHDVLDTDGGHM